MLKQLAKVELQTQINRIVRPCLAESAAHVPLGHHDEGNIQKFCFSIHILLPTVPRVALECASCWLFNGSAELSNCSALCETLLLRAKWQSMSTLKHVEPLPVDFNHMRHTYNMLLFV
jgi:hypothetical protein